MLRLLAHAVALFLFVFFVFPVGVLLAFLSGAVGALALYAHDETIKEVWGTVKEDLENLWEVLLFLLEV